MPPPASKRTRKVAPSDLPAANRDALDDVMRHVRVASTLYFQASVTAPWAVSMPASTTSPFYLVTRGSCLLTVPSAGSTASLVSGDVALVPHGHAHHLQSDAQARPIPFEAFRRRYPMDERRRVRGRDGTGPLSEVIGGFFATEEIDGNPLLRGLAPLVHLRGQDASTSASLESIARLMAAEIESTAPGAQEVLARLVDLLFIQVIRAVVVNEQSVGWLRGLADPTIGRALSLLHQRPDIAWTLDALAAKVTVSRSLLARRFSELVGEAPMRYLARWRVQVAARKLRESTLSLAQIADEAGYTSEFAFNRAFKRFMQVPPGEFRRLTTSTVDTNEEQIVPDLARR